MAMVQPDYAKAVQTLARNQTLVNQARVSSNLPRQPWRLGLGDEPVQAEKLG
jgi:hypothetical protein